VRLGLTPGKAHDNQLCPALLAGLRPKTMVLADRGYDADWIRAFINQKGAWANIPPKVNRKDPICFSPPIYRVPVFLYFFNFADIPIAARAAAAERPFVMAFSLLAFDHGNPTEPTAFPQEL
jgi:hypothetical protein